MIQILAVLIALTSVASAEEACKPLPEEEGAAATLRATIKRHDEVINLLSPTTTTVRGPVSNSSRDSLIRARAALQEHLEQICEGEKAK